MTILSGWAWTADPLAQAMLGYPLLLLLAGWLVLHRLPAKWRPSLVLPFALYALALAGLLAAAAAERAGLPRAGLVREIAVLIAGVACIRVAGQLLFRAVLPATGVRPSSIVATSAVITGIIAFSLQETLANIFGGAALQLEDSIHLGDWIKVDDVVGRVVDIGWHSTLVETRNWETVVIPNAALLRARFTILGRRSGEPRQWRRWIRFSVGYDVPPHRVIETVEAALRRARIAGVAGDPLPNCVALDFGDSAIAYAARYWLTDLAVDDPTDSAVRCHLHAALARAGIAFAYPVATMLVDGLEQQGARARSRGLTDRVAALQGIELFSGLSPAELEQLARQMVPAPFLAGETLTRQGDVAHWLYVLARGSVKVVYESDGERRELGTIQAATKDAFFGEIGMLTGAPRSSSVIALTDVDCLRLDKEGFERVLRGRPAIAEDISRVMTRRRVGLSATRDELNEAARQRQFDAEHGELLGKIRRFFGFDPAAAA